MDVHRCSYNNVKSVTEYKCFELSFEGWLGWCSALDWLGSTWPDRRKRNLAQQTWYAAAGEHSRLFQLTVDGLHALTPSWWIERRLPIPFLSSSSFFSPSPAPVPALSTLSTFSASSLSSLFSYSSSSSSSPPLAYCAAIADAAGCTTTLF